MSHKHEIPKGTLRLGGKTIGYVSGTITVSPAPKITEIVAIIELASAFCFKGVVCDCPSSIPNLYGKSIVISWRKNPKLIIKDIMVYIDGCKLVNCERFSVTTDASGVRQAQLWCLGDPTFKKIKEPFIFR